MTVPPDGPGRDPYGPPTADPSPSGDLPRHGAGEGTPPSGGGPVPYGAPTGRRNGLGTAALVVGVLAVVAAVTVVGGVVLGLVAVVLGALGRGRVKRGQADNGGSALAGIVLGVIAVVASAALIAFGLSVLNSDSGQQYQDCLKRADNDAAAVQGCARQFTQQRSG